MDLRDYLRITRKRWKLIVALPLICILLTALYILHSPKLYQASAQIFVSTAGADDSSAADLAQGNTFTQARVQSYTSVVTSPAVLNPVIQSLKLNKSTQDLAGEVSADAPLNKVLINLHVTDKDPALAAQIANALAAQFSTVVTELEATTGNGTSPVKLTVTQPATVPELPASPKPKLDFAIGILLGIVLGLGLAFLRETLDNTVKSPEDLAEVSGVPVLGIIPWDRAAPEGPIAFRTDAHGTRAEAYRQMRTNLQFVDIDNPPKLIAVSSAVAAEGKSHTSLNLAASLAESGQRVCLVEVDLRKPSLARVLGVVGDVGVTSVLVNKLPVLSVMQNAGENLAVITAGPVPPNPSELINSDAFHTLLNDVAAVVDVMIIDTPPLLPVADGAQLAALADATLLVVRAAKTTHDQIQRAVENLANVGVTPVGTVMSMAQQGSGGYQYYYAEYRPRTSQRPQAGQTQPEA